MTNRDTEFLRIAIQAIERIREKTAEHGFPMVASLLDMAKSQAEDELRSRMTPVRQLAKVESAPEDELEAELRITIEAIRRNQ